MRYSSEKRQHGGHLCSGVISRFAGFLAYLAITAEPALAQSANPLLPRNLSPWGMFLNADIVVKVVMIGLAFASLVTWTVWLAKTVAGSKCWKAEAVSWMRYALAKPTGMPLRS